MVCKGTHFFLEIFFAGKYFVLKKPNIFYAFN